MDSPSRMALFSSLVFNRELTLFADPATWRLHGAWLIYTIFLSLLLVHIDTDQLYSTVALGLFEGAVVEFRTLTAFVLGGFVLLVVGAWRERRGGYSSICSACKALLVTIAATLPLSSVGERRHLGRWVALAFEMAVLKARGQGDSVAAREYLEDTGLLVDDEWAAMEPGNREATVFFWVNIELKNCLSEGVITVFEFTQLVGQVTRMRDAAHDLMARGSLDMPYPYASMIGLLVQIQVALQCTKHALLCVVLYPPYPPTPANLAIALVNASMGATPMAPEPEGEPEMEPWPKAVYNATRANVTGANATAASPEAAPEAEPEAEAVPEAAVEPEPEGEPEPYAEPPSAYVHTAKSSGSYSGITGQGWQTVLHMWFLQLSCLFLWNLICESASLCVEHVRVSVDASRDAPRSNRARARDHRPRLLQHP